MTTKAIVEYTVRYALDTSEVEDEIAAGGRLIDPAAQVAEEYGETVLISAKAGRFVYLTPEGLIREAETLEGETTLAIIACEGYPPDELYTIPVEDIAKADEEEWIVRDPAARVENGVLVSDTLGRFAMKPSGRLIAA